jgi:phosphatidylglycerophosphate synthase
LASSNSDYQGPFRLNIPNGITGLRIVFTLIVIYLLLSRHGAAAWATGIFLILAWATDFIDGYLARRLKMATVSGGLFDLFADRLLMISVLIISLVQGYWTRTADLMPLNPYPFAVPVLAADFILLLGILVFLIKRRKKSLVFPPAPYIARFTFSVQMAALVTGVLRLGPDWLLAGLMYLTILFTLIASYFYLKIGGYIFTQ